MSNFTTEVRYICEYYAGYDESQGYDKVDEIIEAARPQIFDFTYPIFDVNYKPILERKILNHYYTREISYETVGVWKLHLKAKMNEIMPMFNKLYETELLTYNPLWDVDLTEDKDRTIDTDTGNTENRNITRTNHQEVQEASNRTGTSHDDGTNLYSDTPQGAITNLADGKYLTNATITSDDGRTTDARTGSTNITGGDTEGRSTAAAGTVDTTDNYIKHIKGKRGGLTYAKMLEQEVDIIEKIDNLDWRVIRELRDLFFTLWE